MTKDERVKRWAAWLYETAMVPDPMEGMSAHGDVRYDWSHLARAIVESGAVDMPKGNYIDSVDIYAVEARGYDRQAAAIEKIEGVA